MGRDLEDGELVHLQGSAREPYEIKNTGGVYSCTCPAWRNQSLAVEQRTCKHIKNLRGEDAELERVGAALFNPAPTKTGTKNASDAPPVLLAHTWEPDVDVTGWWLSEKLDGVRAYWDGTQFLSRQGNRYHAPEWFVESLPRKPLDGELWIGRGEFQRTVSIVRRQDQSEHWKDVSFLIFDAPDHGGAFEERIEWLQATLGNGDHPHASVLDHEECQSTEHLHRRLAEIEAQGGEGVMARKPGSKYVAGRSHTLLKVKTFKDAEARVVDHLPGAGRHKGRLGALRVELPDGTLFSVGTGLTDREREDPPALGTIITFKYQELTADGVPRFPTFARVRSDSEWTSRTPSPVAKTKSARPDEQPAATESIAGARYFELADGKSSKFWEITVDGDSHTVRYGRIGANGTSKVKSFATTDAAAADADKLIAQKLGKGYVEVLG